MTILSEKGLSVTRTKGKMFPNMKSLRAFILDLWIKTENTHGQKNGRVTSFRRCFIDECDNNLGGFIVNKRHTS